MTTGRNLDQIYGDNPSTTLGENTLIYGFNSPYGSTDDTAILYSNVLTQLESDLPYGDAISNINDQLGSLNSSVTGLGTTLAATNTALQTPATGQLFAANSGQAGADGTITYPLQFLSDAFTLTPPIVPTVTNPWVVNAAPGYYSDPGLPFQIIPYLSYRGDPATPPSLELILTGSFTLGDWSSGGVMTIENFNLVNSGIDLDFFGSSYSAASTINIKNITTGASGIVRVLGFDSSTTTVNVDNLNTTAIDPVFDGVNLTVKNSKLNGIIVSANNGNSIAKIDNLETTTSDGIYLQSTIGFVSAQIINSPNNSVITIDGTSITLSIDSISLSGVGGPDGIMYLNGATIAQVTFLETVRNPYEVVEITTSSTIIGTAFGRFVRFNSAIPITITLPQQSTFPTKSGAFFDFENIGLGIVTFIKEGTDTISGNTDAIAATGTSGRIIRDTTTDWCINGGSAFFIATIFANIATVSDATFSVDPYMPVAGKFANLITKCQSGTANATFDINGTPITAVPNAVSSTRDTEGASAANEFVLGDEINVTFDTTVACLNAVVGASFFYMGNY